jgi:hypothetical protein
MTNISTAVDRAMTSFTMMGMRGDQQKRQSMREAVRAHIQSEMERGQLDLDRLVVSGLKHLVSLEKGGARRRPQAPKRVE